jgi:hypothetical protein
MGGCLSAGRGVLLLPSGPGYGATRWVKECVLGCAFRIQEGGRFRGGCRFSDSERTPPGETVGPSSGPVVSRVEGWPQGGGDWYWRWRLIWMCSLRSRSPLGVLVGGHLHSLWSLGACGRWAWMAWGANPGVAVPCNTLVISWSRLVASELSSAWASMSAAIAFPMRIRFTVTMEVVNTDLPLTASTRSFVGRGAPHRAILTGHARPSPAARGLAAVRVFSRPVRPLAVEQKSRLVEVRFPVGLLAYLITP